MLETPSIVRYGLYHRDMQYACSLCLMSRGERLRAMGRDNETQTTNTQKAKPKDNSPGTKSTVEKATSNTGSSQQSLEWE